MSTLIQLSSSMRIEFYLIFHYIGFAREKAIGPSSDICVPFFLACTFSWQHSRNVFFLRNLRTPLLILFELYKRCFPRWEKAKDPGDEFWRQIRMLKAAVSLLLNGMLIHPDIYPGNRAEVFTWQNFQPAYRNLGNRAGPPSNINTSTILQRI